MRAGDFVEIEIEKIGVLSNPVTEENATKERSMTAA
jgi:fumarylacetoacetate (FAA) hydrolase family protein